MRKPDLGFQVTAAPLTPVLWRHCDRALGQPALIASLTAFAAGLIVFIGGALPLVEFALNKAGLAVRFALSLPSPLTAWQLAFDAPFRMWGRSFGYSLLLTQALSWLFLILAGVQLPRLWRSGAGLISPTGRRSNQCSILYNR